MARLVLLIVSLTFIFGVIDGVAPKGVFYRRQGYMGQQQDNGGYFGRRSSFLKSITLHKRTEPDHCSTPPCGGRGQECCSGYRCCEGLGCNLQENICWGSDPAHCDMEVPSCGRQGASCCTGFQCCGDLACQRKIFKCVSH